MAAAIGSFVSGQIACLPCVLQQQSLPFLASQAPWDILNMPTVLTISGSRVVIFLNDHGPAHVHVLGADKSASFALHCPEGPVELRSSYGYAKPQLKIFRTALTANIVQLCRAWEELHG